MLFGKQQNQEIFHELQQHICALDTKLNRLDFSFDGNGGPYKRILECREIARAVSCLPQEERQVILSRLAFIDSWLTNLIPLLTENMIPWRREQWELALKDFPVDQVYDNAWHYFQPAKKISPDRPVT